MLHNLKIQVSPQEATTAVVYQAPNRVIPVTVILAHGAGAGQSHPFMVRFSDGLAARGVDAVTFNFLYTEQRRSAPDRADKLEACYAAVISAVRSLPEFASNRLVIGGKSMGGRIASQVAASNAENIAGLVFLGYPLHPPGKPDQLRSKHLPNIKAPMLFVQGSRDSFGSPDELAPILQSLPNASIFVIEKGDHSFNVPKKNSPSRDQVYDSVLDEIVRWIGTI